MSRVRIVVNNTVEFDGELNDYTETPPDVVRDMLRPDAAKAPWLMHAGIELVQAIRAERDIAIFVTHKSNRWRWTMEVMDL